MRINLTTIILFYIFYILAITLDYLSTSFLVQVANAIILPLGFFSLLIITLINSIRSFRKDRFYSFFSLLLVSLIFFLEPIMGNLIRRIDWAWNLENRLQAIDYIQNSEWLDKNINSQRVKIPDELGYVSKDENNVWVEAKDNEQLTIRFLIKEGHFTGAMPDYFFVYTKNGSESLNVSQINRLDSNWFLEAVGN